MYSYKLDGALYYSKFEISNELKLPEELVNMLVEKLNSTQDRYLGEDVMKIYEIGILAR